jgi:hypothetical protein
MQQGRHSHDEVAIQSRPFNNQVAIEVMTGVVTVATGRNYSRDCVHEKNDKQK